MGSLTWNMSSVGGLVSAAGKIGMALGIIFPPALAIGAGLSAVGSIVSGLGADKTPVGVKNE